MLHRIATTLFAVGLASLTFGCIAEQAQRRANAVEYLYPQGAAAQPPCDVHLDLPLRVGLAFAPSEFSRGAPESFDESTRRTLLERIAAAFRNRPEVERVETLPSHHLKSSGGFENVDQLAAMHGLNVIALVSYDQIQFDDPTVASLTYWTILGAYVVQGDRHETRTMLDIDVFDIPSRALLFSASGSSQVERNVAAIDVRRTLRETSRASFEDAADALIADVDDSLARFREQIRSGTVRGVGTPAITVSGAGALGGSGVGGGGLFEALAAAGCIASRMLRRRSNEA